MNRGLRKRSATFVARSFEPLEERRVLAAMPVISEFVAANEGELADGWNRSPDWIEIWNRGDEPVDLVGYTLSDTPQQPALWQFPSVSLDPDTYLVVFASGETEVARGVDPAGNLHTNFRLGRGGDYLELRSANGELISQFGTAQVDYPEQLVNVSFGIQPNSDAAGYFSTPTPGSANTGEFFADFVRDTKFSFDRGYYENPVSVEIVSETPSAEIRYTLDGTEPTLATGIAYSGPIMMDHTTVVRAAAFRDGFLPTNIDTQTYFFLADVKTQTGAGLPETWGTFPFGSDEAEVGTPVPANYEVDPQVVNDPRYSDSFVDDLQTLPTISLVVPPDELWSEETGIYANTTEEGLLWERAGSVELISAEGESQFQIDAGVRVHGGFGRRPAATAKHSFRLFFRGDYDAAKLEYPWFGDDVVSEFDTIVLRAHYNYSWSRGDRGGVQTGKDYTMLNDRWANLSQQEMGGLAPNGAYAHLYVNGLYWGVYNPTERPDASFQATHLGGEAEDYDVHNHEGVVDGDPDAWSDLRRLVRANPLNYEAVEEVLDVDNFIDYMIVNQFGGNGDWPQNNWYASRLREPGGRWQFHTWDSEFFFVDLNADRIRAINNSGPGEIFRQLLDSDAFRLRFADRIQKQMFNGGVLTQARNIERMDAIAAEIDRAMVAESARWGDGWMNQRETPRTRDDDWLPRLAELRDEYFPARHDIVIEQYRRRELFPETLAPELSRLSGEIEPGTQLVLDHANAAGTIHYTLDGSDPRSPDGTVAPTAQSTSQVTLTLTLTEATTVLARVLNDGEWSPLLETAYTVVVPGDVSGDGQLDVADIDHICQQIAQGENEGRADLNSDGVVDLADRDVLLAEFLNTGLGDVNLDGVFNSSDLILVFQSGLYEDDEPDNASWVTGDWNCDREFNTSDIVQAFQAGAYSLAAERALVAGPFVA